MRSDGDHTEAIGSTNFADISFDAIADSGWTPPDPVVAKGPESIIAMTNGAVSLYSLDTYSEVQTVTLEVFFGLFNPLEGNNGGFDPRILYDQYEDKFVCMKLLGATEATSTIHFAVSRSSNPATLDPDDWRLSATTGGSNGQWADYPGFGLDDQNVYLTANMFIVDSFQQTNMWIVEKTAMYNGDTPVVEVIYDVEEAGAGNVAALAIMPTHTLDANPGDDYYLFSVDKQGISTNDVNQYTFNRVSRALTVRANSLPSTLYLDYEDEVDQEGDEGPVAANDHRFTTYWPMLNGRVWISQCVATGSSDTRPAVSVMRVNPAASAGSAVEDMWLIADPEVSLIFPAIAVTSEGHAALTVGMVSSDIHPGVGTAVYNGTSDTWSDVRIVQQGLSEYWAPQASASDERWGDYAAAAFDPADPDRMWFIHQFAGVDTDTWATRIFSTKLCDNCDHPTCPQSCTWSGVCDGGVCPCDLGTGQDDGYTCPNNCPERCNGNGVCIFNDAACECATGWTGDVCDTADLGVFVTVILVLGLITGMLSALYFVVFRLNHSNTADPAFPGRTRINSSIATDNRSRSRSRAQSKAERKALQQAIAASKAEAQAAKARASGPKVPCPLCGAQVLQVDLESHVNRALDSGGVCEPVGGGGGGGSGGASADPPPYPAAGAANAVSAASPRRSRGASASGVGVVPNPGAVDALRDRSNSRPRSGSARKSLPVAAAAIPVSGVNRPASASFGRMPSLSDMPAWNAPPVGGVVSFAGGVGLEGEAPGEDGSGRKKSKSRSKSGSKRKSRSGSKRKSSRRSTVDQGDDAPIPL